MSSSLTLSVGIPTFNQAEFLPQTLDSLLNQTHPPDEILVSDHYSTDDTQAVLTRYDRLHPGRIRVVQPPPNTNLTGQYNFTLSSLSGDWITLLSSDDVARPHFCETLLRGAAVTTEAVLVRSGWQQIDAHGNVRSTNYLLSVPRIQSPPENLTTQKHGPHVNFAAFALQRAAFLQSGPILPTLESLSDWALFLQIAPFGPFIYEHALISGYRVGHDGNKFRERLPLWIRDQQRIFAEVLPLAAHRCQLQDPAWIQQASLYNYTRYLAQASREFAPHEREPIVALFQPWADSLNSPNASTVSGSDSSSSQAQTNLSAFAAGEVTRTSLPLSRRLKRALRPLFQRFHSILRRS